MHEASELDQPLQTLGSRSLGLSMKLKEGYIASVYPNSTFLPNLFNFLPIYLIIPSNYNYLLLAPQRL